jgi:signal peptidase II
MLDRKKTVFYTLLAVFLIGFDRFFKVLALNQVFDPPVSVLQDWFKLGFSPNYNIAFSIPFSGFWLNVLIGLMILGLLFYLVFLGKKKEYKQFAPLTFLIFGAISNFADRLSHGFVVDYFDLKYFTVFNLADVMIVGGVLGLLSQTLTKKA